MTSYPAPGWRELADFEYMTPLQLKRGIKTVQTRRGDDADYIEAKPYRVRCSVDGVTQVVEVPEGMATDLASVPRLARSVVGHVGPHLEASIVHDRLYLA